MRKKLSFLIALAISLSISTTSFAAAANTSDSTTNTIQEVNGTINLTLDDALNNIENSNTEIKLMKEKVNSLQKQYDLDHNQAVLISTTGNGSVKLQAGLQLLTPQKDEQTLNDEKNAVDERLNAIKFDMERQYMNVLTCNDQINNINKTIANIDEQIQNLQQQINLGQATSDSLNSLNVQRSQLLSQIDDIKAQIDQSYLTIKQYLNIDLSKNLNLAPAQKDFVKFDDTDIANKINQAAQKDYSISSIQGNMNIAKQQQDLYSKYDNDASGSVTSAKANLLDLQNSLITKSASLQSILWSAYYTLKSDEIAVETQMLSEKSAQDAYDKAKSNYDNGMIDKVSLDSAALALDKQKNLTQRAIDVYMVAQEQFKYMLDGHASANLSTQSIGDSSVTGY